MKQKKKKWNNNFKLNKFNQLLIFVYIQRNIDCNTKLNYLPKLRNHTSTEVASSIRASLCWSMPQ